MFLLFSFFINAQNNQNSNPYSWTQDNLSKVNPIVLKNLDIQKFRSEDAINDLDKSIPWRFGADHLVSYGLDNSGVWDKLSNGDRIWRVNFVSPNALTINLIFDSFQIPVGGKVFIYNGDYSQKLNVFTHEHNNPEKILGTWPLDGNSIWIEYYEPKKASGLARLNIGNIIHGYRTVETYNTKALNDSGDCNVDINCDISGTSTIANDIKDNVKKSVGMLVTGGSGFCTGVLVNNTNNDGIPYFLTANHCVGGSVAGWAFRFNWASDASVADCATTAPSQNNSFIETASGAILRASNSESDVALVEITDATFFGGSPDVVWAGWNRSTTLTPTLNVGVHHPSGDIQKVCVDFEGSTRSTTSFNGNPSAEMWRIEDWDLGVTEPGSSGSPLFDQDGLIIGQLAGGSAACSGTTDNGGYDIYGRFGVSWDFSATNSQQLKFWLDPAGTNPISLVQYPPLQVFDFNAGITVLNVPTQVCEGTITPTLRITNAGSVALTSATVAYQLDSGVITTINWTGNLATGEIDDIVLNPIAVSGDGAHTFGASVTNPNGNTDQSPSNDNNNKAFNIPISHATSIVTVTIIPDRYGAETTWELRDSNGALIASGGPYTTTGTDGTQPPEISNVNITAFNQCYTFTIIDSYGDGICCAYGSGSYMLEDENNNVIASGNGDFGSSEASTFNLTSSLSVEDNDFDAFAIFPNPNNGSFTIKLNSYSNKDITVAVYDIRGRTLFNNAYRNKFTFEQTINISTAQSGMYLVKINDGEREAVKQIIVK